MKSGIPSLITLNINEIKRLKAILKNNYDTSLYNKKESSMIRMCNTSCVSTNNE